MADLVTKTPVPAGDLVTATPLPETTTVTPQQADITATQQTEGAFTRGVRSGFNQLGAMGTAFAGNLGESMGLTDFAAERFKEAEDYVRFADAVSPVVKDYRQVKDFDTLMQYVLGSGGQAAAMFVPGVAGAAVGARVGGVRGAFAGAGAGSFVPNAGEQALRIRDEGTPGGRTANMLAVGGINAALDTVLPGGAAARMLKPGLRQAAGKTIASGALIEGATEGAQEFVGQAGHTAIAPERDKSQDAPDIINSTLQGAIGGAGFGATQRAAELAPGAIEQGLRGLDTLKSRVGRIDDVRDADDLSKIIDDPDVGQDPEAIGRAVEQLEGDETADLERVAKAMGKKATEVFDTLNDPEARAKFKEDAKKWVNDHKYAPRVKSALKRVREAADKAAAAAKAGVDEARAKPNLQRTKLDEQVLDLVKTNLSETARNNMTPSEMIDFAGAVKHFAMFGFGSRAQVEGPVQQGSELRRDQFPDDEAAPAPVAGERETVPDEIPPGMLMLLEGKTVQTLQDVNRIMGQGKSMQTPPDFKQSLKETGRRVRERNDRLGNVVREHLRDDIFADPEQRRVAIEGFRRMLNDTSEGSGERLQEAAVFMFNDAKAALDAIQDKDVAPLAQEFDLTDEEIDQFDPQDEEQQADAAAQADEDFGGPQAVRAAWDDERVNRTYGSFEEAKRHFDDVTQGGEYDPKKVRFKVTPQIEFDQNNQPFETGRYTLEAHDAEGVDTLSPPQWQQVRDVMGQSGFESGVISVKTKDKPGGIKVSIPRATALAMGSVDRPGDSFTYVPDMVLRGLGMILGDPNVTGLGTKTSQELEGQKDLASWDIPDETLVAVHDGRRWTWGDVKERKTMTPERLKMARLADNPVEAAQQAESIQEIEEVIEPWVDDKIAELQSDLDAQAAGAPKTLRGRGGDRTRGSKEWRQAFSRVNRMLSAKELILDEKDRREREGDKPFGAMGEKNVDKDMLESVDTLREQDPDRKRLVQEETGLPLQGEPGRASGRAFAKHETGITDTAPKGSKKTQFDKLGREIEGPQPFDPKMRLSAQAVGEDRLTKEQKVEARDYLTKVLGPQADLLFRNMAEAGSFAELDGVETIAISNFAKDHVGVTRHEAAHALFKRLLKSDKKAAQTLLAAAQSPHVVTRLKELLKGEPDALKQLSDPQERVSYMYQFWAADQLRVGPKTKTWFDQVKKFFKRVAAIWGETASDVFSVEKAEAIFDMFDQGQLSDRNTVAEVLRTKMPKSPYDRATEVMGPVWKFFDKAFFTADGYVRSMNVPAFNGVMDKMYTPLGRQNQEPGFIQSKHQVANEFLNELDNVMRDTTEVQQREALEALQSGRQAGTQEARRIVAGVRSVLRNAFDYMQRKGVKAVVWNDSTKKYDEKDIGFVENYFPRYYDRQYIEENRLAFVEMLRQSTGMSNPEATAVYQNVTRVSKAAPDENDFSVGLTYYAPNTQARRLDVPADKLAPFLRKDLHGSLASYLSYVARRGEYASRFGNQGQEIEAAAMEATDQQGATPEQTRGFRQAMQAMEGSLGHDISSEMKGVFGAMTTYQNIRLLPLALFSSLVDPLGIAVRGGTMAEAFSGFVRGIRGLVSEAKDDAYDLARVAGTIAASHDAHMLADAYGSQYMTGWQRAANNAFFKYNGLESWNRSMRVQATAAAEQFIIRHSQKPNEHSARYMAELNLAPADVKVADGSLVINDKVKQALNLWVDGAVLRPNAAIRPIWMSDPHWMLVSYLKQFTYNFQKTIIARVVHEAENGNTTPALALLSYVPAIIAADVARALLTPGGGDDDRLEKLGLSGILGRGVQRAGLFGPGQYALDAYGDLGHDKIPLAAIGGPTFEQVYNFGVAAAGRGDMGKELARAVPGYVLVR